MKDNVIKTVHGGGTLSLIKKPFGRIIALFRVLKRQAQGSLKVAINDGMQVGKGVSVIGNANFGSEPYLITLEDNVRISGDVTFITHDGGTWAFRDLPEYADVIKYGKIRVGERTFVGARSTIMPGVTIGKRCVVATGSVVTKDVPDGTVVAGVPARVIMTTEEYAQKSKDIMKPYDKEAYLKDKKAYLQRWL